MDKSSAGGYGDAGRVPDHSACNSCSEATYSNPFILIGLKEDKLPLTDFLELE